MKLSFKLLFSSLGAVALGLAMTLTPLLIQAQPLEHAAREKAEEAYILPTPAPAPLGADKAPIPVDVTGFALVLVFSCFAAFVAFYMSRMYITGKKKQNPPPV